MIDVHAIRPGMRYRRTKDFPMLDRLCREAWEPRLGLLQDPSTKESIRLEAVRAAVAIAQHEDDLDVLARYHATTMVSSFIIGRKPRDHGPHRHLVGALGCSIMVPTLNTDGQHVALHASEKESSGRVPSWIGDLIAAFEEAWIGYGHERAAIVMVNRGLGGKTVTWSDLLDLIPVTRSHIAHLQAETAAPRLAA